MPEQFAQAHACAGESDSFLGGLRLRHAATGIGDAESEQIGVAPGADVDLAAVRVGFDTVFDCILDQRLQ